MTETSSQSFITSVIKAVGLALTASLLTTQAEALPVVGPNFTQPTAMSFAQTQPAITTTVQQQPQTLAQSPTAAMQPAQPQADPCESNLISIFGDDTTLAAPSDVLLNFIERQCLPFAQQSMANVVVPYFCFYTGSVLVGEMQKAISSGSPAEAKSKLAKDYCQAVGSDVLSARSALIERTLDRHQCIDSYLEVYESPLAVKFDPISRQIVPRKMCQELVTEINTLIGMGEGSHANSLRYSYLVSQTVDIQTQETDSFSTCIEKDALVDPGAVCTGLISQRGMFELYSPEQKAEACRMAVADLQSLQAQRKADNGEEPDACATLTAEIFGEYTFFIEDLTDKIVGDLTAALSARLAAAQQLYTQSRNTQAVNHFLQDAGSIAQAAVEQAQYQAAIDQQTVMQQQKAAEAEMNQVVNQLQTVATASAGLDTIASMMANPPAPQPTVVEPVAPAQPAPTVVQQQLNNLQSVDSLLNSISGVPSNNVQLQMPQTATTVTPVQLQQQTVALPQTQPQPQPQPAQAAANLVQQAAQPQQATYQASQQYYQVLPQTQQQQSQPQQQTVFAQQPQATVLPQAQSVAQQQQPQTQQPQYQVLLPQQQQQQQQPSAPVQQQPQLMQTFQQAQAQPLPQQQAAPATLTLPQQQSYTMTANPQQAQMVQMGQVQTTSGAFQSQPQQAGNFGGNMIAAGQTLPQQAAPAAQLAQQQYAAAPAVTVQAQTQQAPVQQQQQLMQMQQVPVMPQSVAPSQLAQVQTQQAQPQSSAGWLPQLTNLMSFGY